MGQNIVFAQSGVFAGGLLLEVVLVHQSLGNNPLTSARSREKLVTNNKAAENLERVSLLKFQLHICRAVNQKQGRTEGAIK